LVGAFFLRSFMDLIVCRGSFSTRYRLCIPHTVFTQQQWLFHADLGQGNESEATVWDSCDESTALALAGAGSTSDSSSESRLSSESLRMCAYGV
jgi:hypothetical protein